MPRKKVDKTGAGTGTGTGTGGASTGASGAGVGSTNAGKEEDPVVDQAEIDSYDLPKSIVTRLSKSAVEPQVKLQKDVPLAMIKGSTVFVNYLAALAHDYATDKNHKTITAQHVIESIGELGWDDGPDLTKYLKKELSLYRKSVAAKKASKAEQTASRALSPTPTPASSSSSPSSLQSRNVAETLLPSHQPPLPLNGNDDDNEDEVEPYDEEAEYDSAEFRDDDVPDEPEEDEEGEEDRVEDEGGDEDEEEDEEEGEDEDEAMNEEESDRVEEKEDVGGLVEDSDSDKEMDG